MSSTGRLLHRTAQWLRRSESDRLLRRIEAAPRATPEQARLDQLRRLQALLEHAERTVPYYRALFRGMGITSRDIRTLDDFARLPVLTKDLVRAHQRDLVREDVPLHALSVHHSGGSTGVPLAFYRDRAYMDASNAGTYRNLRQCGWRPGDMVAFFWGWNERLERMPGWEFEIRQRLRRMYQFDPFRSGPADMDRWLDRWGSVRPRVALGYASTIARFAQHIEATRRQVPPLAGVFTTAEKLYRPQREVIQRVFRCRVFDLYGSSEVQNIAAECAHGRMHVNSDFVVVEEDRSEVPADGPVSLLVTSLWSYAMPFIRYRNEDCGRLLPGRCECGSGFPLMELNIARQSDNFLLPNGRTVHGEFFTHLMYGSEGVASFQFHQTAAERIVLRVVPGPGSAAAREAVIRRVVAEVEALAPGELTVEVAQVGDIARSAAGKHRFTRSDVVRAHAER